MMSPCWAHVGMLIGWDTTFDAVTENLTVTAQYEEDLVVIVDEDVPEAQGATTMDDEEVPEALAGGFPWWWIPIGIFGAGLIFYLIYFRKRRKKEEQKA